MTKKPDEMAKHIRTKTCVICLTKWQIEWYDGEAWIEYIKCPNCRAKEVENDIRNKQTEQAKSV